MIIILPSQVLARSTQRVYRKSRVMSVQSWQKNFSLLTFNIRKLRDRFQTAYSPTHICGRKLSHSSLQVTQIEANGNIDEFDESYIYECPTSLIDGDNQIHASINKIMQEIEIYSRFYFDVIPNRLTIADWTKLLQLEDAKRRAEYLRLYRKEKAKKLKEKRATFNKSAKENHDSATFFNTSDVVPYKYLHNSLFGFRNMISFVKKMQNLLLVKKAIFGPHIIIDCSYETHMSLAELKSCARQLSMLRLENKRYFHPFNIIHCNLDINGLLFQNLRGVLPDVTNPAYVFHYTEKNYVELFPREKFIYLSPHADKELETYDPDSVYIIGAFVDHTPKDGLSTERAQLEGIRSLKFPLDKYSNWCKGTKSLMLNQVVNILYDIKEGVSWEKTLSENVQMFKRTYTGVLWHQKGDPTAEALSVKHIHYNVRFRELNSSDLV